MVCARDHLDPVPPVRDEPIPCPYANHGVIVEGWALVSHKCTGAEPVHYVQAYLHDVVAGQGAPVRDAILGHSHLYEQQKNMMASEIHFGTMRLRVCADLPTRVLVKPL